jgi:hypothetical protein
LPAQFNFQMRTPLYGSSHPQVDTKYIPFMLYTSSMWKLKVPSRVHVFLWLLANNKTLTRDNLAKSKTLEYKTYVFGLESESVHHLFFGCCVDKVIWHEISDLLGMTIEPDFESVAKMWILREKCKIVNVCTSAVLWVI